MKTSTKTRISASLLFVFILTLLILASIYSKKEKISEITRQKNTWILSTVQKTDIIHFRNKFVIVKNNFPNEERIIIESPSGETTDLYYENLVSTDDFKVYTNQFGNSEYVKILLEKFVGVSPPKK